MAWYIRERATLLAEAVYMQYCNTNDAVIKFSHYECYLCPDEPQEVGNKAHHEVTNILSNEQEPNGIVSQVTT